MLLIKEARLTISVTGLFFASKHGFISILMKRYLLLLLLGAFWSCTTDNDQSESSNVSAHISGVENGLVPARRIAGEEVPEYNLEERMKELGIPGLSIAVVANGEIEWAKAYGYADVAEQRLMTTESLLLAASISKPFTALRALQLSEEGVFDLDTDINNYLSSWKVPENEFTREEKVNVRRILNHTAGLTVWGFPGYIRGGNLPTTVEVLDGLGNTDPVRVYKKPGESWMYSGGGYTVLQLAITDTEGVDFPTTMKEHVLDPLKMEASTFENPLPVEYHSIAATGYRYNGDEVEGKWPVYPEMAAAGLWTTPSDLIQYAIEIQKISKTKVDGILKTETIQEMLKPGLNGHGLGPGVDEYTFGHGGADEGFRCRMIAWKDKPYAIAVMVNSDNGSIIQEVLLSFVEEYDLPGIEPDERTVVDRTNEQLKKYTGVYNIEELGDLELTVIGTQLTANGEFLEEPAILLPENDTLFFDPADWQRIDFDLSETGEVNGFWADSFRAERIR